jgi:membrane protease YdiL (CAAX protease family)
LSAPENPQFQPIPPLGDAGAHSFPGPPVTPLPVLPEDPIWSGWDVLQIVLVTISSIFVFVLAITFAAHYYLYPQEQMFDVGKLPLVTVAAQFMAYLVVLAFMFLIVKRYPERSFLREIRWNWPRTPAFYLLGGVVLSFALQGVAHFLPMPKELPIDTFFQTAKEAWVLSIFGVTLAPLIEEFFFRGFLYPVLARRWGIAASILLTAATFGLIHAPQLGKAWGPVLIVFLVGVVLTITRAITKSVAAGLLIHIAYNGTISVLLFWASDGFRHLDKLNNM